MLAAFGQFLLEFTRSTDVPARMSGNRFGIILPDTSKRGAHTMVERLTQSLAALAMLEERGLSTAVTVSFGVCGYPWGGDTVDAIVRQAEMTAGVAAEGRGEERPVEDIPPPFRHSE